MKKTYFLIVLILCGLSVGNLCASASAAAAADLGQELIDAATRGDEAKVEELIAGGAEVNTADFLGYTALMWAIINRHENIVKKLLRVPDINVNGFTGYYGESALILAAEQGLESIVQLLLDAGAATEGAANVAREMGHEDIADIIEGHRRRHIKPAGKR